MRCFAVLLLALTLSVMGCNTERVKAPESGSANPQKPYPEGIRLEGTVGVGSISGAEVTVHGFVNGTVDWQTEIGSSETDDLGRFSIEIEDQYLGSPAVVRVVGIPFVSQINCGLSMGCGEGTSFGGVYQLDETLEVFLAIPSLQRQTLSNPSILSHLAFKAFENLDSSGLNGELIHYRIEQFNSMVASRFGVLRNLLSLPQPDLTLLNDNGDFEGIRAMAISLAALQATQRRDGGTVSAALQDISNQYITDGLPDVNSTGGLISFADVLREASVLVSAVQQQYGVNLNGVISQLDAQQLLVNSAGTSSPTLGFPSDTAGLTSIDKGKSLADDVRRFASSVDLKKLAGLSSLSQLLNDGPLSILDLFNSGSASDDVLEDEDVDHAMSALAFVAEAAFTSLLDYYADSVILTSYEGINFQHYVAQNSHVFNFQTDYDPCKDSTESCVAKLDISLIIRVTRFTGNAGTKTFAPDGLDIRVAGSAEVGDINLVIPENDFQFRSIKPSISISDYAEDLWAGSDYLVSADATRVRLPFEVIKAAASEEGGHYKGSFSMDIGKLRLHYTDRSISAEGTEGQSKAVSEGIWRIKALENLKVGYVEQPEENLASALHINQAMAVASETLTLRTSVIHCEPDAMDCEEKSDFFIDGETDEQFLSLNASAAYKTKLKAVSDSAFAQLTFSRNSPSATAIDNIQVSYPGHGAVLTGSFNSNGGMSALNATNLDGIGLFFNTVSGKRTGEVQDIHGDQIADVIDMGQWVKIHYIDGDFESL